MKKDHCDLQQLHQNCSAALREYLFYEEKIYNKRRKFFLEMYRELGCNKELPNFEQSLDRWGLEYNRGSSDECPLWLCSFETWDWMSI
jgi:hypothetical protein